MSKVTVLICDDSALMRKLLTEILSTDPDIEVVGSVSDAMAARRRIKQLDPDVLTLDVEMPGMNGIAFLERLMQLRPMPVVMISAMTQRGADTTMKALMLGAVDVVGKPQVDMANSIETYADEIREKVKTAAATRPTSRTPVTSIARSRAERAGGYRDTVIAIGASTGGVEAINRLLSHMPADLPPILITQHIPPIFSRSFATRLNDQIALNVCEASDGQRLESGHVYIAPGDRHLALARKGSELSCRLSDGPRVNRHIPSVDVLFHSVARLQPDAVGILLTGMGEDGARGLREMKDRGATTIAQDETSSVVWGMPGAAVRMQAAKYILPLPKIAERIVSLVQDGTSYTKERLSR